MSCAPQNAADDRLLNKLEVEEITDLSRATINRMVKADQIPSVKVGKRRLFRKSEIMAWIAALKTDVQRRASMEAVAVEADKAEGLHYSDSQFSILWEALDVNPTVDQDTFDKWLKLVAQRVKQA